MVHNFFEFNDLRTSSLFVTLALFFLSSVTVGASDRDSRIGLPVSEQRSGNPQISINNAKEMLWDYGKGQSTVKGDVVIEYDSYVIRSQEVVYRRSNQMFKSVGAMSIKNQTGDFFTGENLIANLETGRFSMNNPKGKFKINTQDRPLYLQASSVTGTSDTEVSFQDVSISPYNMQIPYYDLRASSLKITGGNFLSGNNIRLRIREVPIFYWPSMEIDVDRRITRWEVHPGISSRDGIEVEGQYNFLLPSDNWPVQGGFRFDVRQKLTPGAGLDLQLHGPEKNARFFGFYADRKATFLTSDGSRNRTDSEKDLWRGKTHIDYGFGNTDWRFRASGDWIDNTRFQDDLLSNSNNRGAFNRHLDVSVVRSHSNSIFRLDSLREDRTAIVGNEVVFRETEDVLPQLQYQIFPTQITGSGFPLYFEFNGIIRNEQIAPLADRRWRSDVTPSLLSHVHWGGGFGQSIRLGFSQRVNEQSDSTNNNFQSTGEFQFELRNSWMPTSRQSLDLNYGIHPRVNNKNQVTVNLPSGNFGQEANGLSVHELDLLYNYSGIVNKFTIDSGLDLRTSDTGDIDFKERIIPVEFTVNSRLLSYLSMNQYLRYEPSSSTVRHASSAFEFDYSRRFKGNISLEFVQDQLDEELLQVDQQIRWNPRNPWKYGAGYNYRFKDNGRSEYNVSVGRSFDFWELQAKVRHIEDRDTRLSFDINFLGFTDSDEQAEP